MLSWFFARLSGGVTSGHLVDCSPLAVKLARNSFGDDSYVFDHEDDDERQNLGLGKFSGSETDRSFTHGHVNGGEHGNDDACANGCDTRGCGGAPASSSSPLSDAAREHLRALWPIGSNYHCAATSELSDSDRVSAKGGMP
eukprot:3480428-Pleurochrysis_carterae.AAC.1